MQEHVTSHLIASALQERGLQSCAYEVCTAYQRHFRRGQHRGALPSLLLQLLPYSALVLCDGMSVCCLRHHYWSLVLARPSLGYLLQVVSADKLDDIQLKIRHDPYCKGDERAHFQ